MPNPILVGLGNDNLGTVDPILPSKFYPPRNWSVPSQTGTITNATYYFGPMRKAGTLQALEAVVSEAIATGADRTVTIDLQRGGPGVAYASVLTATIVLNNGAVLRTKQAAAFTDSSFAAGDSYKLTITVAGSAGAQAQGLSIHLGGYEAP